MNEERVYTLVEAGEQGEEVWKTTLTAPNVRAIYRAYPSASVWGEQRVD